MDFAWTPAHYIQNRPGGLFSDFFSRILLIHTKIIRADEVLKTSVNRLAFSPTASWIDITWPGSKLLQCDCSKPANRPFPSSLVPLFQSEYKCETILMKMTLICDENETACKTHFHMKGFALRLVLKQRHKRTRKWPIGEELTNQNVTWEQEIAIFFWNEPLTLKNTSIYISTKLQTQQNVCEVCANLSGMFAIC